MARIFGFILFLGLSAGVSAEVREKNWPEPKLIDDSLTVAVQSLRFTLPAPVREVSTVGLSTPNLQLEFGNSEFTVFQNTEQDVFGPKEKSKLGKTELYNLQKALVFAATDSNKEKPFYPQLNQVFLNGQACCLDKYTNAESGITAYLWNPEGQQEHYGYVFLEAEDRFYRFIGQIDTRDFEQILSKLNVKK